MPVQSGFTSYVPKPCESGTVPVIEPFLRNYDGQGNFSQAATRRPRTLNLNAIVAAHRHFAARWAILPPVVVLIFGAYHPRPAKHRRHRRCSRRYPTYSSHVPSFEAPHEEIHIWRSPFHRRKPSEKGATGLPRTNG